jgi:hypothetical protein
MIGRAVPLLNVEGSAAGIRVDRLATFSIFHPTMREHTSVIIRLDDDQ